MVSGKDSSNLPWNNFLRSEVRSVLFCLQGYPFYVRERGVDVEDFSNNSSLILSSLFFMSSILSFFKSNIISAARSMQVVLILCFGVCYNVQFPNSSLSFWNDCNPHWLYSFLSLIDFLWCLINWDPTCTTVCVFAVLCQMVERFYKTSVSYFLKF